MAPDVPKAQGQKYLAGFFRGKLGDVGMAMTIADQLDSGKVHFNDQTGSGAAEQDPAFWDVVFRRRSSRPFPTT